MRVLQVMAGKGNGGAELYATDIMLSLHDAGVTQCVVMRPGAPRAAELVQAGLTMAPDVLRGAFRPGQRRRMRALIDAWRPDIIHCWMRRAASLVPVGAQAQVIGWFGDYEEMRHFSQCTRFIGVTQDLVDHAVRHKAALGDAFYVPTFSSVDDEPALNRAVLETPAGARVLLTLSRLHHTKGLDTLIKTLPELPDCWLWVAGDGPELGALRRLAAGLGVLGRVRFLGWRTDRGALLRAADICLLPSRYEPFGTVILDAWAAGVAFIACASAGPAAYIRDGETGVLVAADDVAGLHSAIRRVLDDDGLRERLARAGAAAYQAGFTKAAVTARMIDVYREVCGDVGTGDGR
ncbi:MAG: glycosyltransferase [Acidocella sp.]|nr:glycosyltransferase [Acidocella sp.]